MTIRRTRMPRGVPLLLSALLAFALAGASAAAKSPKVIVIGIDGMDPTLLRGFMDKGVLPNFSRLIEGGDFKPLQTSRPPLSPIAWSNFITGMDPGGHGIYDFIHRRFEGGQMLPYLSMSEAGEAGKTFDFGHWSVPLESAEIKNLRKGESFWEMIEKAGHPVTVFRMPVNFPPADIKGQSLSDMGTPDVRGTPGTFSFFTDDLIPNRKDISGGEIFDVTVENNKVTGKLQGPDNPFRREEIEGRKDEHGNQAYRNPEMWAEFTVHLDPENPAAKITVGDEEIVLAEGEWSEWVPVEFEAVPHLVTVSSVGRFYLQQVRPKFRLYVTPLQINPDKPVMPISTPDDWSHELCEELGYFYTQNLPEDTKAFSGRIFTGEEFWTQAMLVADERRRALEHLLASYKDGLLFFYFGSVDQGCHMLWRYADPTHPYHDPSEGLGDRIQVLYEEMDEAMGRVMETAGDDTTIMIMSDHGFGPFARGVHLNSWLVKKGYVKLRNPLRQGTGSFFSEVNWKRTRAYAVGLNGLYVNLQGREPDGVVKPDEYDAFMDELEAELLALTDPDTGEKVITQVTRTKRDFTRPDPNVAPDIVVGYNKGYRSSWESPLGEFPTGDIIVDNEDAWSGDHSNDNRLVPGVLITNRKITLENPALYDLTVAVLDEFGLPATPEMVGKDCIGD